MIRVGGRSAAEAKLSITSTVVTRSVVTRSVRETVKTLTVPTWVFPVKVLTVCVQPLGGRAAENFERQ
jgi:hypothetical protein